MPDDESAKENAMRNSEQGWKQSTPFLPRAGGCLLLGLLLWGCSGDTLTAEERATLATMRLAPLPPSPTNALADDPVAAQLGQQFFFDTRFSGPLREDSEGNVGGLGPEGATARVACATCHNPETGGADPRGIGATSLASAWTARNTPTVINAAFSSWMFWDGRRDSMWSQALAPLENPNEHNTTRIEVARVIYQHYRQPYESLFGSLPPLEDLDRFPDVGRPGMAAFDQMADDDKTAVNRVFANFGKALEAYQRMLVDSSSPFDRYVAGDELAISPAAVRGAKLFIGRAACNECHSGPMFADGRFHNHGVPQVGAKVPSVDTGRHDGIAKVLADEFNGLSPYSDVARQDMLAGLAPKAHDLGAFKTPTLRNVSRTGPYMHTGGFQSLWEVVVWYNEAAGTDNFVGTRSPASIAPLRLTDDELSDLVEFLRVLEGDPLPPELARAPALP